MEPVLLLLKSFLIQAAKLGTGARNFVQHAHPSTFQTQMETVFLFLINAELLIKKLVLVLAASEDMIQYQISHLLQVASYLLQKLPARVTQDANYGTGKNNFVLNVLQAGSLARENVGPFLPTVNQVMLQLVNVLLAIWDMILAKAAV